MATSDEPTPAPDEELSDEEDEEVEQEIPDDADASEQYGDSLVEPFGIGVELPPRFAEKYGRIQRERPEELERLEADLAHRARLRLIDIDKQVRDELAERQAEQQELLEETLQPE